MTGNLIANSYAEEVCGIGTGSITCSFLMMGSKGWECAKSSPFESHIRMRRMAGTMNAMGDNCSGPPDFEKEIR